ncbi:MAG TPA: mercuric reductase [Burkholderiaceae bacterium]|jgi:pyruvate/2-oxoglutarate dehydrogenase complex dihydrolipoamide dehydrogenase (E3) component|nr:mercuric reductase [Burkholderiaceae bacterium]
MKIDVILIGTGQAAVPLATRLAAAGTRVLIAERGSPGGTCVNIGCTPTKTLVASARAAHVVRTAARLGVHARDVTVDFAAVMARKDAVVARWRGGVERRLNAGGDNLRFVRGHARFVAPRTVEVAASASPGGLPRPERYEAERIVINVGARSVVPAIPGLHDVPFLDSSGVLALRTLPRHLLVLGSGYIGCELGQLMRRLGAAVTVVGPSQRLLSHEDPDVSESLAGAFQAEGITLALGKKVERVAREDNDVVLTLAGGEVLRGSHLLVATGRRPNTDDLGCEQAGIALTADGHVQVDERYETTARGTFAVGDCTPGPAFTHVSWDDHRVLFEILSDRTPRPREERLVPYTVFTDPQVAGVGLSEGEARSQGIAFELATMPFGNIARAIETDETAGVVKVLIDPATDRILGARIVGVDAGELIHVFSVLMQAKASARAIVDGEFVHPTFAEGLQTAVMKLPRYALS